ncbi:MAG: hypothetical protein CALGDGBN_01145 [Pseudomonadales bacterium]|nr:hypothetical protein [Pseudomonadales bacterium]
MARKSPDGKTPGSGRKPGADAEAIFGDKRTGQDRRGGSKPIDDNRRKAGERRKAGTGAQATWWLERDYVESHHFVQKSTASRGRAREDESADE